jgi:hypothetical protein
VRAERNGNYHSISSVPLFFKRFDASGYVRLHGVEFERRFIHGASSRNGFEDLTLNRVRAQFQTCALAEVGAG